MLAVHSLAQPVPQIATMSYYVSDEEYRLTREYQSCKLLLKQLQEQPKHTVSTCMRSRIHTLRNHIQTLEPFVNHGLVAVNAPHLSLDEGELHAALSKIKQMKKCFSSALVSNEELLQHIDTLPGGLQDYLDKRAFDLHSNRKQGSKQGSKQGHRVLREDPTLLCSLKESNGQTLLQRVEQVVAVQVCHTINPFLHRYFGAQLNSNGAVFRVFAPNAKSVAVKISEQHGKQHGKPRVMKKLPNTGVWEVNVTSAKEGQTYEYIICDLNNVTRYKTDPFGIEAVERRTPRFRHESVIRPHDGFQWEDNIWLQKRKLQPMGPLNILEAHAYVWKRLKDNKALTYDSLADELIKYCRSQNYTHVQLMALLNYPSENSMGYQVTNYFAPNFRLGNLREFKSFVNKLHKAGIGIFIDFSSAHFPRDDFALRKFDGTPLFEKIYPMFSDPKKSLHPFWGNYEFKYDSSWVQDYIASCAYYWISELHIDGIRFDAVSNTISKSYARPKGHYLPNHHGGSYDYDAERFFRFMNSAIHAHAPGVLLMAENSSHAPLLKKPAAEGGIDFDLDWQFNRQADFFRFFSTPFEHRKAKLHLVKNSVKADGLTSLTVASHDEFAHGKKSLLDKMPGYRMQKFANCRLYHSMLYCSPGRGVLSCMGIEFAQPHEWSKGLVHPKSGVPPVQWSALKDPMHRGVHRLTKDLGALYIKEPALHAPTPVTLFDDSDKKNCVVRYVRQDGSGKKFLIVHNFLPKAHRNYPIPISKLSFTSAHEILNTDAREYAGSGLRNPNIKVQKGKRSKSPEILVNLPPLSTLILELR